ncbi:hypothetical protein FOA52_011937 [Chlamydomonas sp. UWO 241]|nr:hypothetical protein FOA52_011937 [Chlamydomonas sp. UWO 241]
MRPPMWLRQQFTLLDEQMFVPVKWGKKSRFEKTLSWVCGKPQPPSLSVWYCNKVYHPLEVFTLYGTDSNGEFNHRPYVPAFIISRDADALKSVCTEWAAKSAAYDHGALASEDPSMSYITWLMELSRGGPKAVVQSKNDGVTKMLLDGGAFTSFFKPDVIAREVIQLAMDRNEPQFLMKLITCTRRELRMTGLHVGAQRLQEEGLLQLGFDAGEDIELFLINYIRTRRNPLSVTWAIMEAIQVEITKYDEADRYMETKYASFKALGMSLLDELATKDITLNIKKRVLIPADVPMTVNEVSPFTLAMRREHLDFFLHEWLIDYVRNMWCGWRFIALTQCTDERAVSVRNVLFGYRVLTGLGFNGGAVTPLLQFAMKVWHLCVFTSAAFFNSPRGRWLLHAESELVFLILFQILVLYPDYCAQITTIMIFFAFVLGNFIDMIMFVRTKITAIMIFFIFVLGNFIDMAMFVHTKITAIMIFFAFVLGNLIDMAMFVRTKYGSLVMGIPEYTSDSWNVINILTNTVLMVMSVVLIYYYADGNGDFSADSDQWVHMTLATTAVLVWVRALSLVVPVYPSLAPLLSTMSKMVAEVIAFVFPYFVILSGFSTLMTGVYADRIGPYNTWLVAMLTLFQAMLGDFDFGVFDEDMNGDPMPLRLVIYGKLSDRFGLLEAVPPEGADAQAEYDAMTAAIHEVATNHLAPRGSRRRRGWQFTLSQRTLRLMDARQRAHSAWLRSKSAAAKRECSRANRAADAAVQRDRERWIGQQVAEAQDMLRKKNLRQFARACNRLAGRSRSHQIPPAMRDVSGALHSGPDGVLKAMTESFDKLYGGETKLSDETLNQLENDVAAFELTRATEVDEAHVRPPDLAETEACVRALRSSAAPGG